MTTKKNTPRLSVIIPLFNEEKRLKNLVKIYNFLQSLNLNFEFILINDGSTDNTLKALKKFIKKFKIGLLSYETNRGKGFAVRQGMLSATGEYLLFTDIDLSTPIEELVKFFPHFKKSDVVIGSRRINGSKLQKHQPWLRETLGRGFTYLSKKMLGLDLSDFTCGFKCFSRSAAIKIFSQQKIERWGFDPEILFLARKFQFKIKEVPVTWANDPRSRVKLPKAIITSISDLIKIRYNNLRKLYN